MCNKLRVVRARRNFLKALKRVRDDRIPRDLVVPGRTGSAKPERVCPFGIESRFCEYQETRARDLLSAVRGDLVFLCKLSHEERCPKLKEVLFPTEEDSV